MELKFPYDVQGKHCTWHVRRIDLTNAPNVIFEVDNSIWVFDNKEKALALGIEPNTSLGVRKSFDEGIINAKGSELLVQKTINDLIQKCEKHVDELVKKKN